MGERSNSEMGVAGREQYNYWYLTFASLTVTLSSFIGGYQIGVFNTCQNNVGHTLGWGKENSEMISVMTALMPVGGMVGSLVAGHTANRLGRRWALIGTAIIEITSSLLVPPTQNILPNSYTFGLARFLGGLVSGLSSSISPVFGTYYPVKELVPDPIRGFFVSLVQVQITLGICVSYAMGVPLPYHNYGNDPMNNWWQAMFLLPGVIAVVQIALLFCVVGGDSPQWLMEMGQDAHARKQLSKVYTPAMVEQSILKLQDSLIAAVPVDGAVLQDDEFSLKPGFDEVVSLRYRKALLVCCGVATFQQLSGINTFIFYSTYIIRRIGGHDAWATVYTTGLGAVNMSTTLLILPFIDSNW